LDLAEYEALCHLQVVGNVSDGEKSVVDHAPTLCGSDMDCRRGFPDFLRPPRNFEALTTFNPHLRHVLRVK
jgi:hypothetical protein